MWWLCAASLASSLYSEAQLVLPQNPHDPTLLSATLPNATEIAPRAFIRLRHLSHVVVGQYLQIIGDFAFSECTALLSFTIGPAVERIGIYAFSYCTTLAAVNTDTALALRIVGRGAFYQCSNLVQISFPPLAAIGNLATYGLACCPTSECNSCPSSSSTSHTIILAHTTQDSTSTSQTSLKTDPLSTTSSSSSVVLTTTQQNNHLAALAAIPIIIILFFVVRRKYHNVDLPTTQLPTRHDINDGYCDVGESSEDENENGLYSSELPLWLASSDGLYDFAAGSPFADHAYEAPVATAPGTPPPDAASN